MNGYRGRLNVWDNPACDELAFHPGASIRNTPSHPHAKETRDKGQYSPMGSQGLKAEFTLICN